MALRGFSSKNEEPKTDKGYAIFEKKLLQFDVWYGMISRLMKCH